MLCSYYTVFHKKEPHILHYNFRIFWSIFIILLPLEIRMNTPQSHVIYLLDDVITVTRGKSRHLTLVHMLKLTILSLRINFWQNPCECKRCSVRRLLKEFSNKHGKKQTLNDFLRKFGTIGSTERTTVSGGLFLVYQVEWRHSKVEVRLFMPAWWSIHSCLRRYKNYQKLSWITI